MWEHLFAKKNYRIGETYNMKGNTMNNEKYVYSIDEFCHAFSLGRSATYEEIRAGNLRVRKAGTRTLITHEDAMTWLNALPIKERQYNEQ